MHILKSLFLPPLANFLLIFIGSLTLLRARRLGIGVIIAGTASLYLFCTPYVGTILLYSLQRYPPLSAVALPIDAGAIVILGGDIRHIAPEVGPDAPGFLTLERLRAGAEIFRRSHIPLAVSGGPIGSSREPLADIMRRSLEQDFRVPVRWQETHSGTTLENAKLTAELLIPAGIGTIVLVTHAWHMPRAKLAFEASGLTAIPASVGFRPRPGLEIIDLLPSADGLRMSYWAIHEHLGNLWYRLRIAN